MTKQILIGAGIVITAALIIIFWKPIWAFLTGKKDDLDFEFKLVNNASDILNSIHSGKGIGAYIDVPLTTIINNKKGNPINLKNMMGNISYDGESILQTKENSSNLKDVSVPAKGETPTSITDSVQVLINPSTIKYFTEFISGKKPQVKYNFTAMVLGKPQSFTNITTIK